MLIAIGYIQNMILDDLIISYMKFAKKVMPSMATDKQLNWPVK